MSTKQRAGKAIKVTTMVITPAKAKSFLSLNVSNRPLAEKHVAMLAGAMLRGEWQVTGESIKFSVDNALLDGQHRLSAIVKSGVSVEMLVVEGLPVEAFHAIDVGAKTRSTRDIFAIAGEQEATVLASASRLIKAWERDPDLTGQGLVWTVAQLEDVLSRHPGLRKHTEIKAQLKKILSPSFACAFSYLFSLSDPKVTEQFMDRLGSGVGLEKGNPILQLRDILMANKVSRSKLPRRTIAAIVIKAFNSYLQGKQVARLRWVDTEKFPEIAGVAVQRS